MTDLAPEQLDKARRDEAVRRLCVRPYVNISWADAIAVYQAVYAEGWAPTPPVDPVRLAVREIVADYWGTAAGNYNNWAKEVRAGAHDRSTEMLCALAAYRAAQAATEARYEPVVDAGRSVASAYRKYLNGPTSEYLTTFDAALSALERSGTLKTMGVGE